jgi:hypothetical protein
MAHPLSLIGRLGRQDSRRNDPSGSWRTGLLTRLSQQWCRVLCLARHSPLALSLVFSSLSSDVRFIRILVGFSLIDDMKCDKVLRLFALGGFELLFLQQPLTKAIRLPNKFQNRRFVRQPVQQRGGHFLVAK